MNVYVAIRIILHALLFLVNLIALTVASGMIAALKGEGYKATAGSVLVIIGFIFYAFIVISLWSEAFIPRSKLSKNRTEAIVLPLLFLFQLVAAIVNTAETSRGVCINQPFCAALLVLSWMATVTLLVYYMITMIVIFHHYHRNNEIWDVSPLSYSWFATSNGKAAGPPRDLIANPPREIARPPSIEIAPIVAPPPGFIGQHRRQPSSWMPPPLDPESKMAGVRVDRPVHSGDGSAETFENVPLGSDSGPALEPEADTSRISLGVPGWARKWLSVRRGVGIPFPLTPSRPRRKSRSPSLDVPATPTNFTDD